MLPKYAAMLQVTQTLYSSCGSVAERLLEYSASLPGLSLLDLLAQYCRGQVSGLKSTYDCAVSTAAVQGFVQNSCQIFHRAIEKE